MRQRLKKAAEAAFILDNEMSSIRQEILEAQRDFEDQSRLVHQCLALIQELYFYHKVTEAVQFQQRFNTLWEREDRVGIKQLEEDIIDMLRQAKKSGSDGE